MPTLLVAAFYPHCLIIVIMLNSRTRQPWAAVGLRVVIVFLCWSPPPNTQALSRNAATLIPCRRRQAVFCRLVGFVAFSELHFVRSVAFRLALFAFLTTSHLLASVS